MWETIPDIKVINKIPTNDENIIYEFEIGGYLYRIFIYVIRRKNNTVALEIHFSSKAETSEDPYTDDLTGRNNMQDVIGSV
jgi:hypothetical protein